MSIDLSPTRPAGVVGRVDRVDRARRAAASWLSGYSIEVLRVSLGLVFLGFGALKFFPGVSPAEHLAIRTVETLTFGVVRGAAALVLTAIMECFVGLTLVSGKLLRTGLMVLGVSLIGIMSPLVLFFNDLFPGAPTLEAQYVLKDIVLAAAGMVVAAKALGARLVVPGQTERMQIVGHWRSGDYPVAETLYLRRRDGHHVAITGAEMLPALNQVCEDRPEW